MLLKHVGKAHILDYKLNHVDVHQQKLCAKPTKMRGMGQTKNHALLSEKIVATFARK